MVRLWPRRRPAQVDPEPDPNHEDETTLRLRVLAAHYQQYPDRELWTEQPTGLLPIITPAARERGWGRR